MREIKFRAWSHGLKSTNPVIKRQYGEWISPPQMLYDEKFGDCLVWKSQGQNIEVMQYTGLKDKNGKEIYEGDIVEDSISTGKVMYSDKRGGYRVTYTDGMAKWFIDYSDSEFKVVEVIGNIYENPELLEVQA